MSERERQLQARALEGALEELRGIRGAKVELTPAGVKTVRVLVVPERTTPDTVRDVQQIVADRIGSDVDTKRIQVLRSENAGPNQRRKLTSVLTERSGERFTARVTLELAGDVLVGESDAPVGQRFEYRSMARATLEGLGDLIQFPIELQSVHIMSEGDDRFAVVTVARADGSLVGTASVTNNEYEAIARATLDAVNRFLARPLDPIKVVTTSEQTEPAATA